MYGCVPNLSTEEEYPFLNSTGLFRSTKSTMFEDEELMELLWQNGDLVVVNNKTQRRAYSGGNSIIRAPLEQPPTNELFIHEDEMASWLTSYPIVETTTATITNPIIATTAPPPPSTIIAPLPAISTTAAIATTVSMFSDPRSSISINPNVTKNSTTVIGSNETPAAANPKFSNLSGAGGSGERAAVSCGDCGTSASMSTELPPNRPQHKRKERPTHDKDVEIGVEVPDAKRQVHGMSPTKRRRTAEVHNLSERRRRNKLNEKMKTLQDLIPHCSKTDKASILDDAIEHIKSLQQISQMTPMRYGMMPMMYPGMQQYVPPVTIGMSVEPVTNRPTLPYPLWGQASSEHFSPRFPVPAFHMQPVSLSDQHISQATSPSNLLLNLHGLQSSNAKHISTFNPYQHYPGINQAQVALTQNQVAIQRSSSASKSTSEVQSHDDTRLSG